MNLLALPGIHNLKVVDKARSVVNDRQDAMFVMDVTGSTVAEVIGNLKNREIDDNYTACYYPDLKLNDRSANKMVRVSPSVAVMGAISFSDRVGQVFFAPAGLNRGGLGQFDIVDVADRLNFQDRNDLYDNRINPIATFPNEGIVVFGQKTLQIKASALDRINVRRLLIFAKKTIASAAKLLVFEPNNPATWQRFVNVVNPILEKVRQDQGIERFRVVMDTTTNTADLVDRNIMTGKIFLQPTKSAEFIDLSFIITNAGVSFGE
jgi:phage tail sheath protein FI